MHAQLFRIEEIEPTFVLHVESNVFQFVRHVILPFIGRFLIILQLLELFLPTALGIGTLVCGHLARTRSHGRRFGVVPHAVNCQMQVVLLKIDFRSSFGHRRVRRLSSRRGFGFDRLL